MQTIPYLIKKLYSFSIFILLISCSNSDTPITQTEETQPIDIESESTPPDTEILSLTVTQVGTLPEPVSNNALTEGFINNEPFLFSFGGIDETKLFSGIHLRSYRYNINTGTTDQIPDLPDTMGKIASAASRIDTIIYIAGGYHVFSNGSEVTSGKMHRYDITNNVFLEDAPDIPVPTDDHVQAVWRNQLIYLITGWNTTANIPNVQIYNPETNAWLTGTNVPTNDYRSFGASGTIIGDTIYYFGGATSDPGFGIQNQLRIGTINPDNPSDISWSITTPDTTISGYRMAATSVNGIPHWIGGSKNTYNFNGIAYDGSGGVPTAKRDLYTDTTSILWKEILNTQLPMDLRGIADINNTIKYIAGGMGDNQIVSNAIYRLEWSN